jgi:hypothetical protein
MKRHSCFLIRPRGDCGQSLGSRLSDDWLQAQPAEHVNNRLIQPAIAASLIILAAGLKSNLGGAVSVLIRAERAARSEPLPPEGASGHKPAP